MGPKPKDPNTPSNLGVISTNLMPLPGVSLTPLPTTPTPGLNFMDTPQINVQSGRKEDTTQTLLKLLQGYGG